MADSELRIIVIGTSAGGMQALCRLMAKLPDKLNAAIFIVQHIGAESSTHFLVNRLSNYTRLRCEVAEHMKSIEPGTVYMAQADRHLLVTEQEMLVVRGPRENQFRPSIDTLFRSAAAYHGPRTVGLILTGFMSDGVLGMECIKRSGGTTVVQAPDDAEFPVLPQNVMRQVEADFVVAVDEMGEVLSQLVQQPAPSTIAIPTDICQEAQITERIMTNSKMSSIEDLEKSGERTPYTCPECGGGLWELTQPGTVKRYRCHTGHAYNQESLLQGMDDALEETLWVAMRNLEERRNVLLQMSKGGVSNGSQCLASLQETRAEEMKVHIERLRELLAKLSLSNEGGLGEVG